MSSPEHARPPRVVVLMSTYNGERFVAEQLRSILEQLPGSGRVFVRDDGSSDSTVTTIQAIADPRISMTAGSNLGFGRSFLTLLAESPADADLVMFADQDDVWLPGKISRAWQHLQPLGERPALYGSGQMLADAQLRPLHATPPWPQHGGAKQGRSSTAAACRSSPRRAFPRLVALPRDQHVRHRDL
jgi:glycosyltransferase involved in cell wall biosynthesis